MSSQAQNAIERLLSQAGRVLLANPGLCVMDEWIDQGLRLRAERDEARAQRDEAILRIGDAGVRAGGYQKERDEALARADEYAAALDFARLRIDGAREEMDAHLSPAECDILKRTSADLQRLRERPGELRVLGLTPREVACAVRERDEAGARARELEAQLALEKDVYTALRSGFAALCAISQCTDDAIRNCLRKPGEWRDFDGIITEWERERAVNRAAQATPETVAELDRSVCFSDFAEAHQSVLRVASGAADEATCAAAIGAGYEALEPPLTRAEVEAIAREVVLQTEDARADDLSYAGWTATADVARRFAKRLRKGAAGGGDRG